MAILDDPWEAERQRREQAYLDEQNARAYTFDNQGALATGDGALSNLPVMPGAQAPLAAQMVPAQQGGTPQQPPGMPPLGPLQEIPNPPQVAEAQQPPQEAYASLKAPPGGPPQGPQAMPQAMPDANHESGWQDPAILASQNAAMMRGGQQAPPQAAYASMNGGQGSSQGALNVPGAITEGAPVGGGMFDGLSSWASKNKDFIGALGTGLLMGDNFKDGISKGLLLAEQNVKKNQLTTKDRIQLQMQMQNQQDRADERVWRRGITEQQLELQKQTAEDRAEAKSLKNEAAEEKKTAAINNANLQLDQIGEFKTILNDPTKKGVVGSDTATADFTTRKDYGYGVDLIDGQRLYPERRRLYSWLQGEILGDAANMKGALSDNDLKFLRSRVPALHDPVEVWTQFVDEVEKRVYANHPKLERRGEPPANPGTQGGGENRVRVKFPGT